MIIYLLKMIACSAAFYALYHFVFSKEKMLMFNRFYLLGSLIAPFFIPLITFTIDAPQTVQFIPVVYEDYAPAPIETAKKSFNDYLPLIATIVFALVSFILLTRFIFNLHKIQRSIRAADCITFNEAKLILLPTQVIPYSFLNKIFLNEDAYKQGRVEADILLHEVAHIKQKHSWDILFVEFLQIFTWFNPIIYFYKKAVKINHEFLADEAVVTITNNSLNYQQLLLQSVYVNNNIPLASSFYFFTTKKRILMLQKTFKRKHAVWAGMAAVPLLALLVFVFSSRTYAQVKKPEMQEVTIQDIPQKGNIPDNVLSTEICYDKNNKPLSAAIEYKDGKVIKEDISTPAKQKTFEKKYNLKIVAGTPPLLEYQTDSFSVMATKIITGSTKSISMPDTKPKKMEAWMDVQPKARKGKENLESFSPPVIIRDNEIRTESQSKLKEQTFREYDENGNKIPRLQILGTKEDEARIRERILTSTDGRSNSDIKEILVQFHEATSKRYGFVTYNDDKFYQADISSTENKLAFEKKYNVKLGK